MNNFLFVVGLLFLVVSYFGSLLVDMNGVEVDRLEDGVYFVVTLKFYFVKRYNHGS